MKIWETEPGTGDADVEAFLSGQDVVYDQELVGADILVNLAHTQMLHEQGYLDADELGEVHAALLDLAEDGLTLAPGDEDVHAKVEALVTERTDAGTKMHTGRSRNDQVIADTRLHLKQELIAVALEAAGLAEALAEAGDPDVVLPGYTHTRQAMPTTAEVWLGSFAETLLDDLELLEAAYGLVDRNPLGAAAGYGTTLDIDRERTAELLGFGAVQTNTLHTVSSRGKVELAVLDALDQVMLDLDRLATDLIRFSADETGFVELPERFCTGSSIMPQKSNPDVLEVVKGRAAEVAGAGSTVRTVLAGSGSGYNRDTQVTKVAVMDAVETTGECLRILRPLVAELVFDEDAVQDAMSDSINAAYTANRAVEEGTPFREAYRAVKEGEEYTEPDADEIPTTAVDPGKIGAAQEAWTARKDAYGETVDELYALAESNAG